MPGPKGITYMLVDKKTNRPLYVGKAKGSRAAINKQVMRSLKRIVAKRQSGRKSTRKTVRKSVRKSARKSARKD